MKRIEFIAPVEAMRGNLSGEQKLVYAENDNPAFDAPVGSVNYARNYQPRFIGAKRAKDGLKYFSVKTKSAVNLTPEAKQHLAIFGGAAAIYNAMKKSTSIWMKLVVAYTAFTQNGGTMSIRQYAIRALMRGLEAQQADIVLSYGSKTCIIANPWWGDLSSQSGDNVTIATESLVKFWEELCPNPLIFYVQGTKAIAKQGETFETLIEDSNHNILRLTIDEVQSSQFVMLGEQYLGTELPTPANVVPTDQVRPIDYVLRDELVS